MSKIIENPDHLIQELEAALGTHNSDVIDSIFSRYISDAAIAVTAEDIAAQAITWADSQENLPCEQFFWEGFSSDRYYAVQGNLTQMLDMEALIEHIENEWDSNSFSMGKAIEDALFSIYEESTVLGMVVSANARYLGGINA